MRGRAERQIPGLDWGEVAPAVVGNRSPDADIQPADLLATEEIPVVKAFRVARSTLAWTRLMGETRLAKYWEKEERVTRKAVIVQVRRFGEAAIEATGQLRLDILA